MTGPDFQPQKPIPSSCCVQVSRTRYIQVLYCCIRVSCTCYIQVLYCCIQVSCTCYIQVLYCCIQVSRTCIIQVSYYVRAYLYVITSGFHGHCSIVITFSQMWLQRMIIARRPEVRHEGNRPFLTLWLWRLNPLTWRGDIVFLFPKTFPSNWRWCKSFTRFLKHYF